MDEFIHLDVATDIRLSNPVLPTALQPFHFNSTQK